MLAKTMLVSMVLVSSMAFAKRHMDPKVKEICASEIEQCKDVKGRKAMRACMHEKATPECKEAMNNKKAKKDAKMKAKSVEPVPGTTTTPAPNN